MYVSIWGFFRQKFKNIATLIVDLKKKTNTFFEQNNILFEPKNKKEYLL